MTNQRVSVFTRNLSEVLVYSCTQSRSGERVHPTTLHSCMLATHPVITQLLLPAEEQGFEPIFNTSLVNVQTSGPLPGVFLHSLALSDLK